MLKNLKELRDLRKKYESRFNIILVTVAVGIWGFLVLIFLEMFAN